MPTIQLPNNWAPRDYQKRAWAYLEGGGDRCVTVWHRRAGKDEVGLHWTAVSAFERIGAYWHMLPSANQARKAIWDAVNPRTGKRRIDEAFPEAIRKNTRDNEMFLRFKNNSTWQVVGSDNYDSLVGSPPIGVVFSEYALAKPQAWDFIRPILAENGGWAIFPYTARGRNHGADLYEMARVNEKWFAELLTVDDTGVISPEIIEEERASGMSEDMIQQEYYCSFDSAVVGSYYGRLLNELEQQGRIGSVPYNPSALVTTGWDLGYNDATAIWFAQIVGLDVHIIDYYENNGVGLDHYAKVLKEKPYAYHQHLLPHDGRKGELIAGTTINSQLTKLLGHGVTVLPRELRLEAEEGINAVRVLLPRCRFDVKKCAQGLKALRLYRRAYNEERKAFSDRPLHDWTSDPADAFRSLATGLKAPAPKRNKERLPKQPGAWMG